MPPLLYTNKGGLYISKIGITRLWYLCQPKGGATIDDECLTKETREFETFTLSLTEMGHRLETNGIIHVAIESTEGSSGFRYLPFWK